MLTPTQSARLAVVLVSTRNSLNIGAAARALSNFGVLDLRVVRPYEPAFRDAQSAVGAEDLLRNAPMYGQLADAIADCSLVVGTSGRVDPASGRLVEHPVHRLEAAAQLLNAHLGHGRAALLFGSEKFGLSNDDLSQCDWLLHIPTGERQPSMNLGQAVAVCLYELVREQIAPEAVVLQPQATAGERELLTATVMEALAACGYTAKHRQPTLRAQVRRMVARLGLGQRDVQSILGMVRQMLWKMDRGGD